MKYHFYLEKFNDLEKTDLEVSGYFINRYDISKFLEIANPQSITNFLYKGTTETTIKGYKSPILRYCNITKGMFNKNDVLMDIIKDKNEKNIYLSEGKHHGNGQGGLGSSSSFPIPEKKKRKMNPPLLEAEDLMVG